MDLPSDDQQVNLSSGNKLGNPNILPFVIFIVTILIICIYGIYIFFQTDNSSTITNNAYTENLEKLDSGSPITKTEPTNIYQANTTQTVPSNWQQFTAKDQASGITATLSLPPGFVFQYSGSEFVIFNNNKDHTEVWEYATSVFRNEDGLKNFYDGGSRRAWYQKFLNGDFSSEKPDFISPLKIDSVVEHPIGSNSYLEITVSGGNLAKAEKHFLILQNGVIHIFTPASEVAKSAASQIMINASTILSTINSQINLEMKKEQFEGKTCANPNLGITMTIPQDGWSCASDTFDTTIDGWITVQSSTITLQMSNLGRGGPCGGPGVECTSEDFFSNNFTDLKLWTENRVRDEVFGEAFGTGNKWFWISIKWKDIGSRGYWDLADEERTELFQILNSMKLDSN